jgi:hypothetical protein
MAVWRQWLLMRAEVNNDGSKKQRAKTAAAGSINDLKEGDF